MPRARTATKHLPQLALSWALLVAVLHAVVPSLFNGSPLFAMAVVGVALILLAPVSIAVDVAAVRIQGRYQGRAKGRCAQ